MSLKRGEVAGLWIWFGIVWIILAVVYKDFLWFISLWHEVF